MATQLDRNITEGVKEIRRSIGLTRKEAEARQATLRAHLAEALKRVRELEAEIMTQHTIAMACESSAAELDNKSLTVVGLQGLYERYVELPKPKASRNGKSPETKPAKPRDKMSKGLSPVIKAAIRAGLSTDPVSPTLENALERAYGPDWKSKVFRRMSGKDGQQTAVLYEFAVEPHGVFWRMLYKADQLLKHFRDTCEGSKDVKAFFESMGFSDFEKWHRYGQMLNTWWAHIDRS